MKTLALACILAASLALAEEPGRIEVVGKDTVDFGRYPAREKKVATYLIKNVGKGRLEILDVRKTCGCSLAACDKKLLEADETANVEVTVLPNTIFGLYSKNTFVESTDPGNKFLRLTMAGDSVPLVEVSPTREVEAGRIKANTAWTQAFDLKATEAGVLFGDIETESNYKVEARLERTAGVDGRCSVGVTLMPAAKSGDLRCTVSIPVTSPTGQPPIRIVVTGRIGTELSAVPGIAYLDLSSAPQTREFSVRLLGERTRVLRAEELTLPERKDAAFSVKQGADGHGLDVTATFGPEFAKALYAEENIPLELKMRGASSAKVVCKMRK